MREVICIAIIFCCKSYQRGLIFSLKSCTVIVRKQEPMYAASKQHHGVYLNVQNDIPRNLTDVIIGWMSNYKNCRNLYVICYKLRQFWQSCPPLNFYVPKRSHRFVSKCIYICIHLVATVKCTMGKYFYRLNSDCWKIRFVRYGTYPNFRSSNFKFNIFYPR